MGTDVKTMKKERNVSGEQITKVLIIINEGAWVLNISSIMKNWNGIEIDSFSFNLYFVFAFLFFGIESLKNC